MDVLRPGSTGPAVAEVQAMLRSLGLLTDDPERSERPDDAGYDAATELAVRHFQQVRGLSVRLGQGVRRARVRVQQGNLDSSDSRSFLRGPLAVPSRAACASVTRL